MPSHTHTAILALALSSASLFASPVGAHTVGLQARTPASSVGLLTLGGGYTQKRDIGAIDQVSGGGGGGGGDDDDDGSGSNGSGGDGSGNNNGSGSNGSGGSSGTGGSNGSASNGSGGD
ncbi:uncharacterized protein BO96DRAFT_447933, partial [Aspergillus niger CBS 101883]|uniref:uncharacterized protein n=1 Tax=Aspergillus lacticoffeatus (strain CBS 101883) TaxID=1450533 RepID=UPI000D7EE855